MSVLRGRWRRAVPVMVTAGVLLTCAAPAAAVTPPRIDTGALIRSAPVAPPEPTRQSHHCTTATSIRSYAKPGAAQAMMNFDELWRFGRGAGQRIAVIDTGVTPHPRLGRVIPGGDYVSDGVGLDDCDAHGTLVAGIIAARPSSSDAFAGIAPESTIIAIRQSSGAYEAADRKRESRKPDVGSGFGTVRTLAHAIVRAVDLRATVINISQVACAPDADKLNDPALGAAVRYAYDRNVVVVVAAGNVESNGACRPQNQPPAADDPSGWKSLSTIASPAWFAPYVLAVGSVDASTGTPLPSSLNGPWVSVAAPGNEIISLDSTRGSSSLVSAQRTETGPIPLTGTSFATPYVAGTAALIRARYPQLSAREVMDRIIRTAHAPGTGHDQQIGYGVIDPVAALTAVLPPQRRDPNAFAPIAAPTVDPAPDHTARNVALAGVAVCAVVIAAVLALAFPHRRVKRLDPDDF